MAFACADEILGTVSCLDLSPAVAISICPRGSLGLRGIILIGLSCRLLLLVRVVHFVGNGLCLLLVCSGDLLGCRLSNLSGLLPVSHQ